MHNKNGHANDNRPVSRPASKAMEENMHRLAGLLRDLVVKQEELLAVLKQHRPEGSDPH